MMDEGIRAFLAHNHSAAMVTLRPDGAQHAVRVGVALVDGKLWSSGTQTRLRTRHLRRDPRSTLFIFDSEWRWLTLECTVKILDGTDAPDLNLRLFQVMQQGMPLPPGRINWFGGTLSHDEFLETMVQEQRLIYEFAIVRSYGMYGAMPTG
jgi:PPOX class probable F420-dependent enzyme